MQMCSVSLADDRRKSEKKINVHCVVCMVCIVTNNISK